MKTIVMLLICMTSMLCNSQTKDSQINYITGSPAVAGYSIKTCSLDASSLGLTSFTPAPILQVYIASKKEFVGGTLIDEKGKKTTITDLTLEKVANTKNSIFTIVGKNFSRGFTLSDGFILKEESKEIVFYTNKIGIWKVIKK